MSLLDAIALHIGHFVLSVGVGGLVFILVFLAIIAPAWVENAYNAVLFFKQVDTETHGATIMERDGTWGPRTWRRWLHGLYRRTFIYPLRPSLLVEGCYTFVIASEHPTAGGKKVSYRVRRVLPEWWYSRLY